MTFICKKRLGELEEKTKSQKKKKIEYGNMNQKERILYTL